MSAIKGISMLLKIGAVAGSPVTVAGLKDTGFSLNNEKVDVTNKDSNGYQTLLANAGVQSLTITAAGTADSAAGYGSLRALAFAASLNTFSLFFNNGSTIEGSFQITKFDNSGAYNGAETFSLTIESSGQWTFTPA